MDEKRGNSTSVRRAITSDWLISPEVIDSTVGETKDEFEEGVAIWSQARFEVAICCMCCSKRHQPHKKRTSIRGRSKLISQLRQLMFDILGYSLNANIDFHMITYNYD